jgi:hypothetical protein
MLEMPSCDLTLDDFLHLPKDTLNSLIVKSLELDCLDPLSASLTRLEFGPERALGKDNFRYLSKIASLQLPKYIQQLCFPFDTMPNHAQSS